MLHNPFGSNPAKAGRVPTLKLKQVQSLINLRRDRLPSFSPTHQWIRGSIQNKVLKTEKKVGINYGSRTPGCLKPGLRQ